MKKLFLIVLLISGTIVFAQPVMVNGEFLINNGNDLPLGCPTFSDGSMPNWRRTHGTPNLAGTGGDDVNMWSLPGRGEGIAGGFRFRRGIQYCIEIGITDADFPDGAVFIYAVNGLPLANMLPVCGFPPPAVPSSAQLIYSGTMNIGQNFILYTPDDDYEELWIYPESFSDPNETRIVIDYVRFADICEVALYFTDGPIPTGDYAALGIYAGSSFPPGGAMVTVNNIDDDVHFKAGEEVILAEDFLARGWITHKKEAVFVAEIVPCGCEPKEPVGSGEGGPQPPGSGNQRKGMQPNEDHLIEQAMLEGEEIMYMFPNPVTDQLTIKYQARSTGALNIVVKDVNGRMRKSEISYSKEMTTITSIIDFKSLEAGVYFVELTLGKEHVVKKVVKL